MVAKPANLSLGVSAFYHDSAIALVGIEKSEPKIYFAAQEERYSRIKADRSFPDLALNSMLNYLDLELNEISTFAFYEKPFKKLRRIIETQSNEFPSGLEQTISAVYDFKASQYLLTDYRKRIRFNKIETYEHHLSHAASAFFASKFENSAVLTLDGVGEFETGSIYAGTGNCLNKIRYTKFPNSLGLFYAAITSYLGFKVNSGEYKVMGLAPYGKPRYVSLIESELIKIFDDGSLSLNMSYFGFTRSLSMFSDKLVELFNEIPREPEGKISEFHCDVAKSLQVVTEKVIINSVRYALQITKTKNLCYAGGVALNCVANSRLFELLPPENIFIQPAAGDAGGALGSAFLSNIKLNSSNNKIIRYDMGKSFLGKNYVEIEKILISSGIKYCKYENYKDLDKVLAKSLVDNKVIGWFRGRPEFGPRALGARSIIGNAINPEMQRKMNMKIKKRESFRPFAPIVLLEEVSNWFDWKHLFSSEFMLYVANVKKEKTLDNFHENSTFSELNKWLSIPRSEIPAVTHVDYSARIQTIDSNHPFRQILTYFYQITKVPILINTSFNVRNEPIVETPEDAIRCFFTTDIDLLALDKFIVDKNDQNYNSLNSLFTKNYEGEND